MTHRISFAFIAAAGLGLLSTAAIAADSPPAGAQKDAYWAGVDWDDDTDDRRRYGAMPLPDAAALRKAGMVRVTEVDRDDGRIEVEGYDSRGREMEIHMDARGKRVLSVRRDN